jgi:predicted ArsR family transcriptional regulator
MHPMRKRVLDTLLDSDMELTTSTIAGRCSLPHSYVRRHLQDLTAHGVATRSRAQSARVGWPIGRHPLSGSDGAHRRSKDSRRARAFLKVEGPGLGRCELFVPFHGDNSFLSMVCTKLSSTVVWGVGPGTSVPF